MSNLSSGWGKKEISAPLLQMPTYGSGNNEEYLVHVIAVLRLVEQKETAAEVKEAFTVLVAVGWR